MYIICWLCLQDCTIIRGKRSPGEVGPPLGGDGGLLFAGGLLGLGSWCNKNDKRSDDKPKDERLTASICWLVCLRDCSVCKTATMIESRIAPSGEATGWQCKSGTCTWSIKPASNIQCPCIEKEISAVKLHIHILLEATQTVVQGIAIIDAWNNAGVLSLWFAVFIIVAICLAICPTVCQLYNISLDGHTISYDS